MKPHSLPDMARKILYVPTAILAGICLFLSLSVFSINRTILNSEFHKHLFEKNNIYDHTYYVINRSMSDFISDLEKNAPDIVKQHMDLVGIFKNSITPEMVRTNLDSLRDGLFLYFSGQNMFLPDIYFDMKPGTYNKTQKGTISQLDIAVQAFTKIDRINLSTVLFYINRNDISDLLFILKFIYYVLNAIPGISLLIIFLMFIIGLILFRKADDISNWAAILLATCGILGIISGSGLLLYIRIFMRGAAYPLTASLPLEGEVIASYIRDCMLPATIFLLASGIILCIMSIISWHMPAIVPSIFSKKQQNPEGELSNLKMQRNLKITVYLFLCLLIASSVSLKLQSFKNDFENNNFASAVEKMINSNKVTQVISAKDEAIYTVYIKLIDKETETPVSNAKVNINGKSSSTKKEYDLTSITDDTGIARFTVDKGNFKVSFVSSEFPSEYQLPSPFFFDMKTAGTTIITMSLDRQPEVDEQNMGIIEIEVLDKDNKPIPELELTLGDVIQESGRRYSAFSYTNSEGIAVFKVTPGTYGASFTESKFPEGYLLPASFDVTATQGSIARYTIKLANDN